MFPSQNPSFLSEQITEARRYHLDLNPKKSAGTVVVCGGCEKLRADYVVQRNDFPFSAIEFVANGEGYLELGGEIHPLRPGMVFTYGPQVPHVIRNAPHSPMLKYYVDFTGGEAGKLLAQSPLGKCGLMLVSAPREVEQIFQLLQQEGAGDGPSSMRICARLVEMLILKISDKFVEAGPPEARSLETYEKARALISRKFLSLHSVDEAAAACHVNASYLCRLFQRFGHTTPYRFLTKLKMQHAADLLLDQRILVKQAAALMGFSDAFQFSRSFKRIHGLSPEQFLRLNPRILRPKI